MPPLLPACTFLLLTGCTARNAGRDSAELTAAAAKTALVEMMEQTDDGDLRPCLKYMRGIEPKTENDGSIVKFGPLTCYIPKRRFVLVVGWADDRGGGFMEWSGIFVRQGDKWVAKVEEKAQT
jgi:hypothetical protein